MREVKKAAKELSTTR